MKKPLQGQKNKKEDIAEIDKHVDFLKSLPEFDEEEWKRGLKEELAKTIKKRAPGKARLMKYFEEKKELGYQYRS